MSEATNFEANSVVPLPKTQPNASETKMLELLKALQIQEWLVRQHGRMIDSNDNGILEPEEAEAFKLMLKDKIEQLPPENKAALISLVNNAGGVHPLRDESTGKIPIIGISIAKETADQILSNIKEAASNQVALTYDRNRDTQQEISDAGKILNAFKGSESAGYTSSLPTKIRVNLIS